MKNGFFTKTSEETWKYIGSRAELVIKVLLYVLWGRRGIIYSELLPHGQTITICIASHS